jgi:hypothetical protein
MLAATLRAEKTRCMRVHERVWNMPGKNLGNYPAREVLKIGGPEGSCTLTLPADNGLLC